jgi:cytochrome c oxidase subunit IV
MNEKTRTDHITPMKVYILVGASLLILTALTVKISTIHLGPWNAIAALAIAATKALLVALFFMHLLYDRKMYAVVVSSALIFLGIFIGLTMADVLRRGDIYEYQAQPIKPEAAMYSNPKGDTTGTAARLTPADTSKAAPGDTTGRGK